MKTLLTAVAFGLMAVSVHASTLKIGDKMPKINQGLLNVDGKEIKLTDLKCEKGVLVIFSCNSCPSVKAWEERLVALGNEYSSKGIDVVQINSNDTIKSPEDSYTAMQTRAKERNMRFPYVVDSTSNVARAFGATKTPEIFLFDKGGKLVYKGAIDDNGEDASKVSKTFLKDALTALTSGGKITLNETKAIGCGIRFRKS